MRPYDLLVFDWDGTLVDSISSIVACTESALAEVGAPSVPTAAIRRTIGLGIRQMVEELVPECDDALFRRVCVAYRDREGNRLTDFPYHQTVFHGCTPEFEEMRGWDEDLSGARTLEDLPRVAREYVDAIAAAVDVPITLIGTGQGRHQVIDQVEI